jgi:hypothetical protein
MERRAKYLPLTTRDVAIATAIAFGCLRVADAVACSGPPPPSPNDALKAAKMVVVAELISTEQHPASKDKSGRVIREDATFRILEVFKGPYRKGDVIHTVSEIGPGPCGLSAKNTPVSFEKVGKDNKPYAPVLSGRWVIYGLGPEPYELNMLSRSKPMEFGGSADVRELRGLLRRARQP